MKLIKLGKVPEPIKYRFTCSKCDCIFECSADECEEHIEDDFGYYFAWYMTYECPICKALCYAKHI